MIKRTTVRLPSELLKKAQRKAAAEGRTLTSLIEDGLRAIVSENRKAVRSKRVLPRVSTAGGGPAPGIEFTSASALQQLDDLDYVRRIKPSK